MLIDRVSEIARQSCVDLFADYGVYLEPAPGSVGLGEVLFCGVIGFTGDRLRGSVVLAGSAAAVDQSNPVPGGSVRDWVGELTNQLIGRIKNQLLRHGLEVYITTPVVLRGRQLALDSTSDGTTPTPMFFAGSRGGVVVWIDIDADGAVAFRDEQSPIDVAEEGSALLF